jgi:hypothetical protein
MANKLSEIFGLGLAFFLLVLAPQATDSIALAQSQATGTTSPEAIDAVSDGIANLQQQVVLIQEEMTQNPVVVMPPEMTLDQIQDQVNAISAKKEQIAVQVAQIVNARVAAQSQNSQTSYERISQAVELIQQAAQVIAQEEQTAGNIATVPVAPYGGLSAESQIAAIQQKIAQLRAEEIGMNVTQSQAPAAPQSQKTTSQASQSKSSEVSCDASTGTCQATPVANPTLLPLATQPKSVWQSIWDFVRSLFTF